MSVPINKSESQVIIGIDASNIFTGGGLTHVREMINHAQLENENIKLVVWSRESTLNQLTDKPYLKKIPIPLLEKSLPFRQYWRRFKLEKNARKEQCDILFFPGGLYSGKFRPFVTLCGNALPFEEKERKRFGISKMRFKLELTKFLQTKAMKQAKGVVFCSDYLQEIVVNKFQLTDNSKVAYVGINEIFYQDVKKQKSIKSYSSENPFKLLYISSVSAYKHQWILVEAVARLIREGYSINLDLIGQSTFDSSLKKLKRALLEHDPKGQSIRYTEYVESFSKFVDFYKNADAFLFSSSCENLPNILVEAMAAGLPIASSSYGPMPSVLKDGGLFYDPVSVEDSYLAIKKLLDDEELRQNLAKTAQSYTYQYRWSKVAKVSFNFMRDLINRDN